MTATISDLDGIDSAGNTSDPFDSLNEDPHVSPDFDFFAPPANARDDKIYDAEIVDDKSTGSRLKGERIESPERDASNKIPTVDEWMHFFSNVVIRVLTDYYIQLAFSGIDEDLLSEREIDLITLSVEERRRVGRPFAEFSNKNKFMRKHGREIIASGDSIDAVLMLGLWFSRVNRIAAKYKRMQQTGQAPPPRRRERRRYGVQRQGPKPPPPTEQFVPPLPTQPIPPRPESVSQSPEPMNGAFTNVRPNTSQATSGRATTLAGTSRPDIGGSIVYSPSG